MQWQGKIPCCNRIEILLAGPGLKGEETATKEIIDEWTDGGMKERMKKAISILW